MSQDEAPKTQGGKRGALRAARAARRRLYYAGGKARTEINKKKKLGKRIREFPNDTAAIHKFRELYGDRQLSGHLATPTCKGRKILKRAEKRARAA